VFVADRAGTQVVALVLHGRNLVPLVFFDIVLLHRAQALFAREASQHEDRAFANGNRVGVSALGHLGLVEDFVFHGEEDACVLLRGRASARDQNFGGAEGNGCRALVELMGGVVGQLLEAPLVLIDIVAETDLGVDVVTEKVNVCLVLVALVETGELEQGLLDRAVVVDVDGVLEHVVDEVRVGPDEVVESLQHLQVLSLLLVEQVEADLILVKLHFVDRLPQLLALVFNHLFSFLDLFLFLLELLDLFVDLLLHHLEQVLVLDFKLVHDAAEALLELVDLFVELLAHLHLEFVVELFVYRN